MPRRSSPSASRYRPTRRDVLTLGVGAFVVAATPFAMGSRRRLVRRRVPVMGTIADVAVVSGDPRRARAAVEDALAALREGDRTMSRFRADSDVGRLGAAAGRAPVAVGAETAFVLERALDFARASGGVFDPCLGLPMTLWDLGRRQEPLAEAETRPLAGRGLYRHLEVARRGGGAEAYLGDASARVDLGGIAKGHAVDLAARALRRHGIEDGLVNVGGDLVALGVSLDGDPWRVGIQDPDDPRGVAATLEVCDEAVATSGDYEHGFSHAGRRYHHLLDPRTARPGGEGTRSVTVRAPTCLDADAAATAAFLLEQEPLEGILARAAPGAVVVARIGPSARRMPAHPRRETA